jgi:hypothetical protein
VGYALAVVGGFAAVAVNEMLMPVDAAQGSPGMVAFGDMVLFVLAAGVLGLVPSWFLLKLCIDKAPRAVLAIELLVAVMGPVSWLTVVHMAGGPPPPDQPQAAGELLGLFIAFGAIPRIVIGPVVLVIEAVTFLLIRERIARALLVAATLMDLIPLGMFVLHMTGRL